MPKINRTEFVMPPPTPLDKRVVLLVTTGRMAGLHQITGTVSQFRSLVGALPEIVETGMPDGRTAPVGLVAYKRRHVLYKECSGPQQMKTFNGSQR